MATRTEALQNVSDNNSKLKDQLSQLDDRARVFGEESGKANSEDAKRGIDNLKLYGYSTVFSNTSS